MKALTKSAVVVLIVLFFSTPVFAETVFRFSNWLGANHIFTKKMFGPWVEKVNKVAEGRFRIKILPKAPGKPQQHLDFCRDGVVDLTYVTHGNYPGRFDMQKIAELPFLGSGAKTQSLAYYNIYEKYLKTFNEFEGVVVGVTMTQAGNHLYLNRDIRTMDDFKGLKIRVPGGTGIDVVKKLGAIPVLKTPGEIYPLISSGALDGILGPHVAMLSLNLTDFLKYNLSVNGCFQNLTASFIVNQDKFNSMPKEDQQLLLRLMREDLMSYWCDTVDVIERNSVKTLRKMGIQFRTADPEFTAQIKKALISVERDWIEQAQSKGMVNAQQVLAEFRADIKKREKK